MGQTLLWITFMAVLVCANAGLVQREDVPIKAEEISPQQKEEQVYAEDVYDDDNMEDEEYEIDVEDEDGDARPLEEQDYEDKEDELDVEDEDEEVTQNDDIADNLDSLRNDAQITFPRPDQCVVDGKLHKNGERFIHRCSTCSCHGMGIGCVPLCAPSYRICPPGQEMKQIKMQVRPGCFCPKPICVNSNKCIVGGKTYRTGQRFIHQCSSCSCHRGDYGCVPLCAPSYVLCPPGQVMKQVKKQILPGCFCPRPTCVKKSAGK